MAIKELLLEIPHEFMCEKWLFFLQLIHVHRDTPQGKHVMLCRRYQNKWICCDDHTVTQVEALPSTGIYLVVYESRGMASS